MDGAEKNGYTENGTDTSTNHPTILLATTAEDCALPAPSASATCAPALASKHVGASVGSAPSSSTTKGNISVHTASAPAPTSVAEGDALVASAPPPLASAPLASAMAPPPPPMAGVVLQKPVYEMLWDCRNCQTKKLLGKTHRHCPVCGLPQRAADRYYPKDNEKVMVHNHVYFGTDVVCSRCETQNCAAAQHCFHCGFALVGTATKAMVHPTEVSTSGQQRGLPLETALIASLDGASSEKDKKKRPCSDCANGWTKTTGASMRATAIAAGILLVLFLLWFFLRTEEASATVTAQTWLARQDIEEQQTFHESDWCPPPPDAYSISYTTRQSGTQQVPDGQDCGPICSEICTNTDNGDGTFSQDCSQDCHTECITRYRTEPVYDDWCDYSIDRWVVVRTPSNSGSGVHPPPALPVINVGPTERMGEAHWDYMVDLMDDDDGSAHDCNNFGRAKWEKFVIGAHVEGYKRVVGGGFKCDTMQVVP